MVEIVQLKEANEHVLRDIRHLVTELRRNIAEHRGELSDIEDIVSNRNAMMLVAKDGEQIVGMASLYVIQKVGKRVGSIEDVIVDSRYRGQGLGKKLLEALIVSARERKLDEVFLTSNPDREAANSLYTKLGFELVRTNPYKLKLS
jgi:ribosomal protein S18 acetylase RimI-like enzyme